MCIQFGKLPCPAVKPQGSETCSCPLSHVRTTAYLSACDPMGDTEVEVTVVYLIELKRAANKCCFPCSKQVVSKCESG